MAQGKKLKSESRAVLIDSNLPRIARRRRQNGERQEYLQKEKKMPRLPMHSRVTSVDVRAPVDTK